MCVKRVPQAVLRIVQPLLLSWGGVVVGQPNLFLEMIVAATVLTRYLYILSCLLESYGTSPGENKAKLIDVCILDFTFNFRGFFKQSPG